MPNGFAGVRWRVATNTGQIWSLPTQLVFARLQAWSVGQEAMLYDHTRFPQNPVLELVANVGLADVFPPVGLNVALPLERGLYVSYSNVTLTRPITVGFWP